VKKIKSQPRTKMEMNEIDYPSDELTDDFLHAQADVGECLLDEEGFQYRPTQNEMNDNRKEELAFWALKQRARLIEHELYATGSHGRYGRRSLERAGLSLSQWSFRRRPANRKSNR
jgi:hypothetical protein